MPGVTRAEVEELALLARLALSDDEVARMQTDLAAILVHMDALAEVDTTGIAPMTHAVPMDLRLRKDEPQPSLPVEVALRAAPDAADGHFRVPNIIKTQEGA
jgi:aspartyl-tRNA(Asn)/glutamyl-tRNA(Gln) amidotransferase subunit C